MATCETPDFIYPLLADIYYPIVEQNVLGAVKKQWILDKSVASSLTAVGGAMAEDVKPNVNITQDFIITGRVKTDIRISSSESRNSITNILITNIRDRFGASIYNETSGVRAGKPTLFEIATNEPFLNPFGVVEYYKLVLRRSENQAVDV
jgi:hypothetical protein